MRSSPVDIPHPTSPGDEPDVLADAESAAAAVDEIDREEEVPEEVPSSESSV